MVVIRIGRKLILPIFLSASIVGCNKGAEVPPSPPSQTKQDQSVTAQVTNTANPDIINKEEAWKGISIVSFEAVLPNQKYWLPLSLSDSGIVAGVVPIQGKDRTGEGQVILYDLNNRTYEAINSFTDPAQPIRADINEDWVVWSEALDQSFTKWKVHAFDRKKKIDKVVYESMVDSDGNGFPGPLIMPKLYGDLVAFSPAVKKQADKTEPPTIVKTYDLKSGVFKDIVSGGVFPVPSKDSIAWIGKDNEGNRGAVFWNHRGMTQQITKNSKVSYLELYDESIAWSGFSSDESKWSVNLFENGNERKIITTSADNPLQFLNMSPRFLTWESYKEKQQVYDRKLDKVVTLETYARPSFVLTSGQFLLWTAPIPQTGEEMKEYSNKFGMIPHKIHFMNFDNK